MTTFVQPNFWATYPRYTGVRRVVSTVVTEPTIEPLTVSQGKKYARDETYDEALMFGFIKAARSQVEQDTGLALLTQTRDISMDVVSTTWIQLPPQSMPLQSVTSVKTIDSAGATNTLATTEYLVDTVSGRIALSETGSWPSDLRWFQPWVIRIVAGYTAVNLIPPLLVHACGLLVAHYANVGRDAIVVGAGMGSIEVPYSYEAAIGPYRIVTVA